MKGSILVVDDEEVVCRSCERILTEAGHEVSYLLDSTAAVQRIADGDYDVVILDIMMPKVSGLEILQAVKEERPEVDVIMVTGLSQIETAVLSMKLGALDYLAKPFDPDELTMVVARALEGQKLLRENVRLRNEVSSKYRFENIIGSSPSMQQVYGLIAKGAPTNSTILLRGESGTGKELIARAIHYNSLRSSKPFVAVDCGSLSEGLLESELFGHVKGSFTGAVSDKKGLFEVADGGTLFLDEIGNIPPSTQAKLLRVIQEREFKAVGGTKTKRTNIRLITATNKDLREMTAQGTFRDDLYYRLNIFPIAIPPLRERKEDIPGLAFHFLKIFSADLEKTVTQISVDAMNLLVNYDWPGNVRELENTIHRAAILTGDDVIWQGHLVNIIETEPCLDVDIPRTNEELKDARKAIREKAVERIERLFVLDALKRNDWNATRAAEETGMQRPNFQALMKKHHLRVRDKSEGERSPSSADGLS
jgi:DNA-binding NtrC family response regulator